MQVGDTVKVLPPFDEAFPDTYVIEEYKSDIDVCVICGDRDFATCFLEKV